MAAFSYFRTIHFADTDAAGVVFFARYLAIAHEAYEEALAAIGIPLHTFFNDHGIVIPVAKSEAAYRRPLVCGEKIRVDLQPQRISDNTFSLAFELFKVGPPEKRAAIMRTEHVCIDATTRARLPLPEPLAAWVDAGSSLS